MTYNLKFLACINEPFICISDGKSIQYECGNDALQYHMTQKGYFEASSICVKDGRITVAV